jgi:3-oxoacyl-[acyl-carrier-protein] synthase-3
MQPFVVNRHDRIVFPSNFIPELDLSVIHSVDQLDSVIRRDFEVKAPTGTEILHRVEVGAYSSRYELMRDLALNLFWINRFALTLYDKRPTRWSDVPRTRRDVFLPILTPWEGGDRKIAAVQSIYETLPPTWDGAVEDRIFGILFDVFGHRKHHASELPTVKPTVAEIMSDPANLTFRLPSHDPDYPVFGYSDIVDSTEDVPELEALNRWAMVLHNQYPWDRAQAARRRLRRGLPPTKRAGSPFPATPRVRTCARGQIPGPGGDPTGPPLPSGQRARALLRAASHRGAGSGPWRAGLHQ